MTSTIIKSLLYETFLVVMEKKGRVYELHCDAHIQTYMTENKAEETARLKMNLVT